MRGNNEEETHPYVTPFKGFKREDMWVFPPGISHNLKGANNQSESQKTTRG